MDILVQSLPALMFVGLFTLFLLGFQIAFSLMATGIIFAFIANLLGVLDLSVFGGISENIWGRVMTNDTLLAIPFFTFMGLILERCGLAEDLLETVAKLFGPVKGGLAYAVILVGAILAATTGIVAASVMAMGLIALPIMLRYGYDRKVACGVIAASGTLAQIVPPSLVLIVLADQLGRSVGDMYKGAFLPSLILIGLYAGYIYITSVMSPEKLPAAQERFSQDIPHRKILKFAFPQFIGLVLGTIYLFNSELIFSYVSIDPEIDIYVFWGIVLACLSLPIFSCQEGNPELSKILTKILFAILPPILLIFLVLGTIFQGIATPTEAGAMGAVGALALGYLKKKLNTNLLMEALDKTARLSTFVMFILVGARIFSVVFYNLEGHHMIEGLFTNLPGGAIGFLIIVNIMIFFLAFFLDFFELAFIVVPLLAPVAAKLGIDLVWFGVILGVNLQTSFMHPPFGFSLFFLRSVAPEKDYIDEVTGKLTEKITSTQIYYGAIPFVFIQILMVGLLILFPKIATVDASDNWDLTLIYKQLPVLDNPVDPLKFL